MEQVAVKPKIKKKKREKPNTSDASSSKNAGPSRTFSGIKESEKDVDSCEELVEDLTRNVQKSAELADEAITQVTQTEIPEADNNLQVLATTEEKNEILDTSKEIAKIKNHQIGFNELLDESKILVKEMALQEQLETHNSPSKEKTIEQTSDEITIKPYTESQLSSLYTNSELGMLEQFTSQYVEAELKGLAVKQHSLYELLSNYLQIRNKITGNSLELEQLRTEYTQLEDQLWTTDIATATGRATCQDGAYVQTTHQYQKATFHRSVFQSIVRVLGLIRKLTYENHILYSYSAEELRLQIELYIQTAISHIVNITRLDSNAPVCISLESEPPHLKPYLSEIRLCISVLFAFQRKLIQRDSQFLKETRAWLSRLIAILLRLATYQDHLFILSHILRCPAGVGTWGASFVQTPLDEHQIESPFSSHQINHVLSVLLLLLSPVLERERFLEDISQGRDNAGEALWIVVDSEGEEDEEAGVALRENDLVAILGQLPLERLFRAILLVDKRNFENLYQFERVSEHHILRFFAFETVLLRIIERGLQTYNQSRYNQFCKRLSRLIRHIVQYATDQWEQFRLHNQLQDKAMLERLQVEYDAFFLRAIYYLYSSQKLGAWQFLAVVPYHLITLSSVWRIFGFLHDSDATAQDIFVEKGGHKTTVRSERDFEQKLWRREFRAQFEEKIGSLADDELYYLLNTFANMALAREAAEMSFIEAATRDLLHLGFVSENTQESCSKSARTLLTHITSKHPHLLSIILREVRENIASIGVLALYLYEELPITVWSLTDDDLAIISSLLACEISSNESKMARMVLSRLNYDILGYEMHCDIALLVLKVAEIEPGYLNWAWQTILRLKLHINDRAFSDLRHVLEPNNYEVLTKGINEKAPLAGFVALLMTTWGHLVPMVCKHGLGQLLLLQYHQKHEAVLFGLFLIVPLFLSSQEYIINNEKFQEIITNLLNADRGYISMAKSLISVQKTVLEQFGNMIETQIVNFASYDLSNPRCLVRLWINTLVSIPNWNRDDGVLFLLDVIVRASFFHQDALVAVNGIFRELLQCGTPQDGGSGGAISSIFKWVSNNNSNASLIVGSLANYTWLAYVIIELEHEEREKRNGLWRELLLQLNNQKGKVSVDAAIKKAASALKVAPFSSSMLCIYRWAQQAMDAPVEHPLSPLIWQKFFALYLARLPLATTSDKACVGDKFFDGLVNFAFLKRIKRKLQETLDHYQEELNELSEADDPPLKLFFSACIQLFRAYCAWLEEPTLQKSNLMLPSLPALYQPNLLAFIIQGSNTPWYEYLNYDKIKQVQGECVRIWQASNFRLKGNSNKPLSNPGKSMESDDPVERILRRLAIYEAPKAPPSAKSGAPVVPVVDFGSKEALLLSLEPCFKALKQFAHNHTLRISEHKALDCSYQDLVPQLYRSVLNKVSKKIPCKGRNDTVNCSGAALIILEMQEARINDRIQHQIQTNRSAHESLLTMSLQSPAAALCTASVTIQQAIKVLQMQVKCNPASAELGSCLFYHILSLLHEETSLYLPTKTLFTSCLDRLGRSHICGVEGEMPMLLDKILKEPGLGTHLAPHFSPSNIGTTSLLQMYATISHEIGNNFDVAFALLSKFEIDKWLVLKEPKLSQRTECIRFIVKALTVLGLDPPLEAAMLHGLYRKHLLTIFEHQFPEHYGEILVCLLKSSNGTSENCLLAKSVWIDILNCLSRPVQINSKTSLRDQLRLYAQRQKMLQHQELLETAELFAKHFTHERLQYGLYGLYPKCRNYIDIFVILLGMSSHGLIISMLNTHQGLLGDKLSQKIWPYLVNIYAPWIVPYSIQNLKENMASWIQQLADDRSILLPWIPSDGPLAQKVINIFFESVQFLIHTLPGCSNILSFIWQWYVASFAHASVKEHVLGPIHHCFVAFPWESFWPSVGDLECMVRVIDQYLPECHSFLGHVFMAVNWSAWLAHIKGTPPQIKSRVYHCYINLLVKLSNEPNVRNKQAEKVKTLLLESENGDWEVLPPVGLQNVMDWYVMSCDPNVIFRNSPLDIDFRVLFFLKTVSGYNRVLEVPTRDLIEKRVIFTKSYVKLVSVYVNRFKSTVHSKETDLKTVISNQLYHLENVVRTEDELKGILRIFLALLNLESIKDMTCKCFTAWLTNKLGDSIIIQSCLGIVGTCINDNTIVSVLLETILTSYFQNNVNGSFVSSWSEITQLLSVLPEKQTDLEQIMLNQGHILALNALFIQRINKCNDPEGLLNMAVEWIGNVKISENVEPKVPLLWFGIIQLSLVHCEKDEPAVGIILYKFAKTLLQLSEEKGSSRWGRGLLNAIGISKQDTISINFRFLCRSLAGYVLAQLPEMKGQAQVVRRQANAASKVGQSGGNAECAKVLMSLNFGQSQGKIKECEEVALVQIQNGANSMHNAGQFLALLVKQFYIKTYLKDVC